MAGYFRSEAKEAVCQVAPVYQDLQNEVNLFIGNISGRGCNVVLCLIG